MNDRELITSIRDLIGVYETSDDCAKMILSDDTILVSTIDMLHETTDFPKGMSDWDIGWMSVAVSISDVASCGAQPVQILIATGIDKENRFRPIMEGATACAKAYGASISGGDIDKHSELTIVTTAIGMVKRANYCRRDGAKYGDVVVITGTPGAAQAGLDGFKQYWKNLIHPIPQVSNGQKFANIGATSMMDVSDGLAISLYDLCEASHVGISLRDELPILPIPNGEKYFLYGGGDYGLLCTIPATKIHDIKTPISIIGDVIIGNSVTWKGFTVENKGFSHMWN